MTGPLWLADTLAAAMVVVAGYCASRLVLARLWHRNTDRRIDLLHAVMGVAMVGMLVPRLAVLRPGVWEVLFAVAAAGLAASALWHRRPAAVPSGVRHDVPHVVMAGAMVYMLAGAVPAGADSGSAVPRVLPSAMASGSTSSGVVPAVALALVLFMVGYAVLLADRLGPFRVATVGAGGGSGSPGDAGLGRILAPRSSVCCVIAMTVTMGYMLVLML